MGLWGLLGSGNLGNDGSLEAVLNFLRIEYPDAELDVRCPGPEIMTARYGIPATLLYRYQSYQQTAPGMSAIVLKVVGKILDPIRTAVWVRRFDVVIVPGMGVLEATLPMRPWATPYALLWLCAFGKLAGTRVALVSVGANVVRKRVTRRLITRAARLAYYRSYRDHFSRDAMREMGVDVVADEVYPDLAFALPVPPITPADTGAVGVGVMAYHGGNDDRGRADEIHRSYLDAMKRFVRWLVDRGRRVRLFTGDPADQSVVAEILADLRTHPPGLDPSRVIAEPASTLQELMQQMVTVDTVVATRYHNVICALKLSRPTLSIGYAAKNDVLMAGMGLGEFCHSAKSIDFERLIEQFNRLESRREELVSTMLKRNRAHIRGVEQQFVALSAAVLDIDQPHRYRPRRRSVPQEMS